MSNTLPTRMLAVPCTNSTPSTELPVVTLFDRRSPSWDSVDWLMQADLERLLYSNRDTTGAFYRLLNRCEGYGQTTELRGSISLRRASVEKGLVTAEEWRSLVMLTHTGVRVITLVPHATVVAAIILFGESPISAVLLTALDATAPSDWTGGAVAP